MTACDVLLWASHTGSSPISNRAALVSIIGLTLVLATAVGRADDGARQQPVAAAAVAAASVLRACDGPAAETPLRAEQGSAGIMYNLAEHPKSIRAVAKRLLGDAVDASARAQQSSCTADCGADRAPRVVFRVAPIFYLPKQQQQPLCVQLSSETSKRPLSYGLHEFSTIEQLDAWIMQFSQGMGPDGELLYQQCGGNCDPRFTFIIAPGKSGLKVSTEVYCGFTRDRKSDMFNMTTALRPQCGQVAR